MARGDRVRELRLVTVPDRTSGQTRSMEQLARWRQVMPGEVVIASR